MDPRRFIVARSLVAVCLLYATYCSAEKLSPDQKAPPFARGSGGLILKAPFEGGSQPAGSSNIDGVQREEKEDIKIVDGQPVRVVEGSFSYKSPEGLPVSFKYVADENGNKASFKFGTAAGGGNGIPGGGNGIPAPTGYPPRGPPNGVGNGKEPGIYLPPSSNKDKNVDRKYLPPQ
ncbi:larval cuticle protein LCP-22-like [Vespa crabro]|uniref:larval cuticle protein LCP-22-like n=1 Tax=Vespa crabro TaxID=7445 RepID=UPI001EFF64DA|nr:larval cuticle protein LCP-22-like [Vespa crabro]